jgi:hypothetical protein
VAENIADGTLVRVLQAFEARRRMGCDDVALGQSAKVRVCVAFLQEQLTHGHHRLRD